MRITLPHGAQAGPIQFKEPIDWNGLAIVGEAPGRMEIINGEPFTGPAGDALNDVLRRIGIVRENTLVINCCAHQPAWSVDKNGKRRNNDISNFFTLDETVANRRLPTYRGQWLHDSLSQDLRAAWLTLKSRKPRAIALMGATALWGIGGQEGIGKLRGQLLETEHWSSVTLVPTYHTAFALHKKSPEILDTITADLKTAFN
jgi:uracil-DNA glycosylase